MIDADLLAGQVGELALKFKHQQGELVQALDELKKLKSEKDGLKRRADARVAKAEQKTSEWKENYTRTRKFLLQAQAEIAMLKRNQHGKDL